MMSASWLYLCILNIMICACAARSTNGNVKSWWQHFPHKRHAHLAEDFDQLENEDTSQPSHPHNRFKKIEGVLCEYMGGCGNKETIAQQELRANDVDDGADEINDSTDYDTDDDGSEQMMRPDHQESIDGQEESELKMDHSERDPNHDEDFIDVTKLRRHISRPAPQEFETAELSETSKRKLDEYGTEEKTNKAFKKKFNRTSLPAGRDQSENRKRAADHVTKMTKEGKCKLPTPIIRKVTDDYPHANMYYTPSCVQLHACSSFSGCCFDHQECRPVETQIVTLYFEIKQIGPNDKDNVTHEARTFLNHTKCQCMNKERIEETNKRKARTARLIGSEMEQSDQPLKSKTCRCPSPFSVRILENGSCICDCFDRDKKCIHYKDGLSHFDHTRKFCIKAGQCTSPSCTYGIYSKTKGRCPTKHEPVGKQMIYRVSQF